MRAATLLLFVALVACAAPQPATSKVDSTASGASSKSCLLPVFWHEGRKNQVHAAFVSVPDGAVRDVGIVPPLPVSYGASYNPAARKWLGATRSLVSPDGTLYAYWTMDPGDFSRSEVRVLDLATGNDNVVYSGTTPYFVISFDASGLYLVDAANAKRGLFQNLYRLDLAGGVPRLIPGSDRHMFGWGWLMVTGGEAWGIDYQVQGGDYVYSVVSLDLASGHVTTWLESDANDLIWPLGLDGLHRLYVGDGHEIWLVGAPSSKAGLNNADSAGVVATLGGPIGFVSDSHGAFIASRGAVLHYPNEQGPVRLPVGPAGTTVFPTGPCGPASAQQGAAT